jgi:broad specificity phosphatase PhoE
MPRIQMIRHGKAAAGWDGHPDPGLDDLGRRQAEAVAERLATGERALILTSPLARAQETAAPLAERWDLEPLIEPRVAEIPSPTQDLAERAAWLRSAMAGSWGDLEETYRHWRDEVVEAVASLEEDALIFSHFIAINAVAGHCLGEDAMIVFRPDNCSVTTFEVDGSAVRLVDLGGEAETEVR